MNKTTQKRLRKQSSKSKRTQKVNHKGGAEKPQEYTVSVNNQSKKLKCYICSGKIFIRTGRKIPFSGVSWFLGDGLGTFVSKQFDFYMCHNCGQCIVFQNKNSRVLKN